MTYDGSGLAMGTGMDIATPSIDAFIASLAAAAGDRALALHRLALVEGRQYGRGPETELVRHVGEPVIRRP